MSWNTVNVERTGPIATVRFDRRGNLNAFSQELIRELTEVARQFHDDLETQAVILTGTPYSFSAGIDLKERQQLFTEGTSDLQLRHTYYAGVRLCQAWEDMPQITIAAIESMAVGAGVALALACDWRVMGENAFLYVPEVRIGINLQWGALPRLVTLVGPARAKRICILCEKMLADKALEWGLVDEIAPTGAALGVALTMATNAVSVPAPAMRMVKEAVNATAYALHKATGFADGDQSQLSSNFSSAIDAAKDFNNDPG
jgi:enoyl-CoA hydratase/carnithine racemase